MHQAQYNHLISIFHHKVAKATERSRICLLKTASVTGKEYLLDQKTFLLLCLFTDQTRPRKLFRQQPEPDQAWCAFCPACSGEQLALDPFASEQDRSSYAGTLAPKIACAQPAKIARS